VIASPKSPLYRKITVKLVPFLMLLYMVAFLDRVNISFAALTMNRDLGISESLYGFAAGVFFLSYCLFEVPANLMLGRIGARRWLSILMVTWGLVSMGTAFIKTAPAYVGMRLLLGLAESGFFPGVIYYFTFWLPRHLRTKVIALFLLAVPLCSSIGSPISAHLLLLDNLYGMKGWQWLFLLEGFPAVLLGFVTLFILCDGPSTAPWLSPGEKDELRSEIEREEQHVRQSSQNGGLAWHVTRDAAAYFLWSTGIYGLSFWLPKILVAAGASTVATGWWGLVTFGVGALALVWASRQKGFRVLPFLFLATAAGFGGAALSHNIPTAVVCFCVAAAGLLSSLPIFWSLVASRQNGQVAGSVIAIVNSVGAVGAFTGPFAMGWLHDLTHGYSAGLWTIACCLGLGAVLVNAAAKTALVAAETT
jgi:ACS family tartrate transporter-like MFS transporter